MIKALSPIHCRLTATLRAFFWLVTLWEIQKCSSEGVVEGKAVNPVCYRTQFVDCQEWQVLISICFMIYGWMQSGPVIQHWIDLLDSCKDGHISQILASDIE
ncbi:uncharacterized protein LOC115986394 isoform X2 [Quercus lobata]|uniref:uncharacterized protein LOC115986394 isoform X2 n=1 Tax=Quercus lobata TaxID=97700 RepID=UPI001244C17B|nr:uncharacterized protein LOC115986394 isoform X2 [Quercus lobata]